MIYTSISVLLLLAAATLAFSPSSAGKPASAVPPDFTAGGKKDDSRDWLLGPTGLRGWMLFRHEDFTAASRQIFITAVDKGSPADGIVQVNNVILGVFGKPFADDARRSFGHNGNAEAESSDAGMVFGQMPRGKTDATMDDIQIFFLGSPQFRK